MLTPNSTVLATVQHFNRLRPSFPSPLLATVVDILCDSTGIRTCASYPKTSSTPAVTNPQATQCLLLTCSQPCCQRLLGDYWLVHAGELACSGQQLLATASSESFSRGSTDEFELSLPHMGPLLEVHICHNGTTQVVDWHLDLIIVADTNTGQRCCTTISPTVLAA